MSKVLAVALLPALLACAPLLRAQDNSSYQPFSPDQLDNLLAPIALYPDPLLAQVLLAATFPDQVDEAARFVRADANSDDIDTQPWDVSVKAVAHYQTVLYMMADGLDWTTALGQAYVNQTDDVMASVQRLRQEARNAGNLASTPQQDIEVDDGSIEIWPAQGQYCYLPIYDPGLVFFGSGGVYGGPVVTFGAALPIGVWLNYDFDWRSHRIIYHAWSGGRGWIVRSRPFIRMNNVYVNNNFKNVVVNRNVTARALNYNSLARYNSIHRGVSFGGTGAAVETGNNERANNGNKIIQRNGDVTDTRIEQYRGRSADQAVPNRPAQAAPQQSGNAAFGANRSDFGAKAASQRGQSSRTQAAHSSPAPHSGGGGGGSHGGGGGGGSHGGGGGHH